VLNGVSKSTFDLAKSSNSLRQGAKAAAEGACANSASAPIFAKLTPDQRLQLISAQLDKIPDSAGKASVAAKLFGAEWRHALEFIKQLPDTLSRQRRVIAGIFQRRDCRRQEAQGRAGEFGKAFDFPQRQDRAVVRAGVQTARAEWLTKLIDDARKLLFAFIQPPMTPKRSCWQGQFDFFKDLDLEKFRISSTSPAERRWRTRSA
jgi:hypothetical protein